MSRSTDGYDFTQITMSYSGETSRREVLEEAEFQDVPLTAVHMGYINERIMLTYPF